MGSHGLSSSSGERCAIGAASTDLEIEGVAVPGRPGYHPRPAAAEVTRRPAKSERNFVSGVARSATDL